MVQSAYKTLYKVLMNINESGCRDYGMASALIVIGVSAWYPDIKEPLGNGYGWRNALIHIPLTCPAVGRWTPFSDASPPPPASPASSSSATLEPASNIEIILEVSLKKNLQLHTWLFIIKKIRLSWGLRPQSVLFERNFFWKSEISYM